MKRLWISFGILVLLVVSLIGSTIWHSSGIHTEVDIREKGVYLSMDSPYAFDPVNITVKGKFTSKKIDPGGIFLGLITLGDNIFIIDGNTEGLRLEPFHGGHLGGTITDDTLGKYHVMFNADFTKATFVAFEPVGDPTESPSTFDRTKRYYFYPYNGEADVEIQRFAEEMFNLKAFW